LDIDKNNNILINEQDESGKRALHIAVSNGDEKSCSLLLEYKSDINSHDFEGNTPLHIAVGNLFIYFFRMNFF